MTPFKAWLFDRTVDMSRLASPLYGYAKITGEEMWACKAAWREFSNRRTNLLERAQLGPFFVVSSFVLLRTRPRVVIDLNRCIRNWAVSSKFESIRLSLVFKAYWLLVGTRLIGGGLVPDFPTTLTSGY